MGMDFSLFVLLVLLPGIAAMKIHDVVTGEGKREFELSLLTAAMYVVVVYGLLALLGRIEALGITSSPAATAFKPITLMYLALLVALVGGVAGVGDERRWLPRLAEWCGLSRRGWRNTWADAFRECEDQWVSVHLADGRRVTGWASTISSDGKEPSVFLHRSDKSNVVITLPDNKHEMEVLGRGVLVTRHAEIRLVEFLDGVGGS